MIVILSKGQAPNEAASRYLEIRRALATDAGMIEDMPEFPDRIKQKLQMFSDAIRRLQGKGG